MPPTESNAAIAEDHAELVIRAAGKGDSTAIWAIIEPVIRAGETYALPRDMSEEQAIAFWCGDGHHVHVALEGGDVLGTYFLRANKQGGGDHVANAGYITAPRARGRGIARAMGLHSIECARALGFCALQFNFVVATNHGAIRLWQSLGFETVGRLPGAFRHPGAGLVDALVMHRRL